MVIFEKSVNERSNNSQRVEVDSNLDIDQKFLRVEKAVLPNVSELQAVRHYTQLSSKNFSIDTHFYPLGSCTMKYNPRGSNKAALLPGFLSRHPLSPDKLSQGIMACLYDLQEDLKLASGMEAVSLTPAAGAQGEFAGVAMIRAYHDANNDHARCEIIVPDAAHGTNPSSAVMCGYKIREIKTNEFGDVSIKSLKEVIGPQTAGIMLTNPSTVGVFDRNIKEIADIVHSAGGLLYYDGANLNAILGKTNPGIMNFDVLHINVHKTFSTPHGGGGPGAGPIGVGRRLLPFLPVPMVAKQGDTYYWLDESNSPDTIGRLTAFSGNIGVLLRAYSYIKMLGSRGMRRISEHAALNANYLMHKMQNIGYELAYPDRRATHEFIVTLRKLAKDKNVNATDVAKRMLDYGVHAPTIYFPLLISECMLIEPTETEDKETLDNFIEVMKSILSEITNDVDLLKKSPHTMPVTRLDDVKAAKHLNLKWTQENT